MLQYSSKISAVVKKNVILKLFELINKFKYKLKKQCKEHFEDED